MSRFGLEFIICMKEGKDPSMYGDFIEKVIKHVGASDTSVRDVTVSKVLQTVRDKICKYVMGKEDDDYDDDGGGIVPRDIEKTFLHTEMTSGVFHIISR